MATRYVAHVEAIGMDPVADDTSLIFHQETATDGTSENTDNAVWTYKNFVSAAVWNSTLNLVEATFKLVVETEGAIVEVVLYDDSDMPEEGDPEPLKVV